VEKNRNKILHLNWIILNEASFVLSLNGAGGHEKRASDLTPRSSKFFKSDQSLSQKPKQTYEKKVPQYVYITVQIKSTPISKMMASDF